MITIPLICNACHRAVEMPEEEAEQWEKAGVHFVCCPCIGQAIHDAVAKADALKQFSMGRVSGEVERLLKIEAQYERPVRKRNRRTRPQPDRPARAHAE